MNEKEREMVFKQEALRFNFKYRCFDCVHFDFERRKCTLKFPSDTLQNKKYLLFDEKNEIIFCKYFEL